METEAIKAVKKVVAVNGDRVLIEEHAESKKKTELGIIIPDSIAFKETTGLQKHITTGTVLSVGQDCKTFKKGDSVLLGRQDAAPIEYHKKYLVVRESAIAFSFEGTEIKKINTDRVLVQPDPLSKITDGGIIIPENANYEPVTGTALKVGELCKSTQVGEKLLFGKLAGVLIEFSGKEFLILREADVIGEVV